MKDIDFNKFKTATKTRPSETKALFSNDFISFPQSLTNEGNLYHDNKAQALEIFN